MYITGFLIHIFYIWQVAVDNKHFNKSQNKHIIFDYSNLYCIIISLSSKLLPKSRLRTKPNSNIDNSK